MKLGKYAHIHSIKKLAVWCGILLVFFVVFMLIVALLAAQGVAMGTIANVRWTLVFQDMFFFIMPAILVACMWSDKPAAWLHLQPIQAGKNQMVVLLAMLIPICCIPFNNIFVHIGEQLSLPAWLKSVEVWMRQMEESANVLTEQLLATESIGGLLANLAVMSLLAGVGEEFCFRGVLLNIVSERLQRPMIPHRAIWITAIVFSAIHFQFYGFVPRMLLGALFGYALYWTGSLWVPIIMHCTNNGFVVIAAFIGKKQGWNIDALDTLGTGDTLWLGVVSVVITVVLIYFLRRSTTISSASSRTSIGS